MFIEQIIIYSLAFLICGFIVFFYLKKLKRESQVVEAKIEKAKVLMEQLSELELSVAELAGIAGNCRRAN